MKTNVPCLVLITKLVRNDLIKAFGDISALLVSQKKLLVISVLFVKFSLAQNTSILIMKRTTKKYTMHPLALYD